MKKTLASSLLATLSLIVVFQAAHAVDCPNGPPVPPHSFNPTKHCEQLPDCVDIIVTTNPLSPTYVCRRCTETFGNRSGCLRGNGPLGTTCFQDFFEGGCGEIQEADFGGWGLDWDGDGEPDPICTDWVNLDLCCHQGFCAQVPN